MKKIIPMVLIGAAMSWGCTISVVDSHTEKGSQETLSEDQTANPEINPTIDVPVKPIPIFK